MEKAWEYFKTEKDIFMAVIKGIDDENKNLLKKKFGKDFDGINVKTSIKKNEINNFNALCESINIDIKFAKKLKENDKIMENYLRDPNYDIIKKLMYIYNINRESLNEIIDSLSEPEKLAFIYYFGIDRKKMNINTISQLLNVNEFNAFIHLKSAISNIDKKCNKHVEIKSKKVIDNKKVIPANFSASFLNKGYSLNDINDVAKTYGEEIYSVLKKIYGIRLDKTRSFMISVNEKDTDIITKILYGEDNFETRLLELKTKNTNNLPKVKKMPKFIGNLQVYYQKKGYSKSEFIDAFRNLTQKEKKLLFLGFDHSFDSINIDNLDALTQKKIYDIAFSQKEGILYHLINGKKEINSNLYKKYKSLGYNRNIVNIAINALTKKDKVKLNEYFDKLGNQIKKVIKGSSIFNIVNVKLPKLLNEINNLEKTKNLYDYFVTINIDADLLNKKIESLDQIDKDYLYTYYDEKTLINKNNKPLDETLYNIISKLKSIKISNTESVYSSNLFTRYERLGYGRDEVKLAVFLLDEKYATELFKVFDKEGNQIGQTSKNAKINNILYYVLIRILKEIKIIENTKNLYDYFGMFNINSNILDKHINELSDNDLYYLYTYFDDKLMYKGTKPYDMRIYNIIFQLKNTIKEGKNNLYKRYKDLGYSREEIDFAISTLTEKNKKELYEIFDKDGNQIKPIKSVKNCNNIVNAIIVSHLKQIREFINNATNLYSYALTLGIDQSTLDKNISYLSENDKEYLYIYYDKSLNRKGNIKFDNKIYNIFNRILKNRTITTKTPIKQINLYQKYERLGYSHEIVDIAISILPVESRNILYDGFDVQGNQLKKIESGSTLNQIINRGMIKRLAKINDLILKTNNLYNYVDDLNIPRNVLKEKIDSLSEEDKEYLYTYYDENLSKKTNKPFDIKIYNIINYLTSKKEKITKGSHTKINLYDKYKKLGYSQEEIDTAIESLSEKNKKELYEIFDKDGNRTKPISSSKNCNNIINFMIPNRLKKISIAKEKSSDCIFFREYIEEIKRTNIFTEDFILTLNISDENKYYLTIEFIFNKQSLLDLNYIADLLKLEEIDYMNRLYNAIISAKTEINTKIDIFNNNVENIKKVLD